MPTIKRTSPRAPWQKPRKAFGTVKQDNYKFYNSKAWRDTAKAHKADNPLCVNYEVCGGATEFTDHIRPISEGGARYDRSNLQPLCASCNASKTGKQAHGRRTGSTP